MQRTPREEFILAYRRCRIAHGACSIDDGTDRAALRSWRLRPWSLDKLAYRAGCARIRKPSAEQLKRSLRYSAS